jgi:hypothetical protein
MRTDKIRNKIRLFVKFLAELNGIVTSQRWTVRISLGCFIVVSLKFYRPLTNQLKSSRFTWAQTILRNFVHFSNEIIQYP